MVNRGDNVKYSLATRPPGAKGHRSSSARRQRTQRDESAWGDRHRARRRNLAPHNDTPRHADARAIGVHTADRASSPCEAARADLRLITISSSALLAG